MSTITTPSAPIMNGAPKPSSAHELSDAIRAHHRSLAETLNSYASDVEAGVADLDASNLSALFNGLTDFLSGELLPHARGEDQTLYPALDPIIREHGSPTATMRVDHEFIAEYARQIDETIRAVRSASERERGRLTQQLARLVAQLQAIFAMHLAKEERVYLPLVEQAISAGNQHELLAALHTEAEGASEGVEGDSLDVRDLPHTQRHKVIFERFASLPKGASFMVVNDHDPKPLYYQLSSEYVGQLVWQYLEQGPSVWRVRLGKAS